MAALAGTVKLPGLGEVKKSYVAVAGGGIVLIVGVGYYRQRKAAASAPAVVGDPTFTSPDTTPSGPGSAGEFGYGDTQAPPIWQPTSPGIVTNADWKSAGSSLNLGGIDSDVISRALSKVLGGIPVTQDEAEIYHEVVGEIGDAPQGHPPLRLTTTPGTTPPGTTPPGTTPPATAIHWARQRVGTSMQNYMKASHPSLNAAQANQRAATAIDYNRAHGVNPWGSTPRSLATARKISADVWVY